VWYFRADDLPPLPEWISGWQTGAGDKISTGPSSVIELSGGEKNVPEQIYQGQKPNKIKYLRWWRRTELKIRDREKQVRKRSIFNRFSAPDHPKKTPIYRLLSLRDNHLWARRLSTRVAPFFEPRSANRNATIPERPRNAAYQFRLLSSQLRSRQVCQLQQLTVRATG
jgi:hypothetical protein